MQCVRPISTRAIRYHGASGHDHLAQLHCSIEPGQPLAQQGLRVCVAVLNVSVIIF